MEKLRIICVDDDPIALENFKYTTLGCEWIDRCAFFSTPEEAIAYALENPVDMAFLDVDLGRVNGFQLCEKLRAIHLDLPVAFITGNIEYMRRNKRVVKAPYIFKPYHIREIEAALPKK